MLICACKPFWYFSWTALEFLLFTVVYFGGFVNLINCVLVWEHARPKQNRNYRHRCGFATCLAKEPCAEICMVSVPRPIFV